MFSQTIEYALRAVVWLAQNPGKAQTNQQIAEGTHVPAGYLSKVLQALSRAGLTQAQRGLRGGSSLTRAAGDISILDVVNAVDPLRRITSCPLHLGSHGSTLCPLHSKLDHAVATIEQTFASTSIAAILAEPSTSRPLCESVTMLRPHVAGRATLRP